MWEVEYTDEFESWWDDLSEKEQEEIAAKVALLRERGRTSGVRMRIGSRARATPI